RQRTRGRLPVDVLSRASRAGPPRARDGDADVGARRGAPQRRGAPFPRRPDGRPGVRAARERTRGGRPDGGAGGDPGTHPLARRPLAGLRLLVTAGPTREPLDPIRFLSNRSSGRMGYALAESARDRGARVTLLAGATGLPAPQGMRVLPFETADELHALLLAEF